MQESDSPEAIAPERLEKPPAAGAPPQYTQVFADAIVAEARRDKRVIGITAAMAGGTGLQKLADEVPEQYYDVGIAEQNAVLLASGLAIQGAKPVCAIYSTFLQRAYDQIIHDVCLQELDVTFAMDRAGLVGDDGPTHHGAFDISYFRPIPNVVVMAPRDEAMLVHMLRTAIAHDGPVGAALPARRGRGGRAAGRAGGDPDRHRRAAGERRAGGAARLRLRRLGGARRGRDPRRPRPHGDRRRRALRQAARRRAARAARRSSHDLVVTIEENVLPGGFGSAVLEHLEDAFGERSEERARVLRVGLPDRYVTHGKPALLREEVGLTGDGRRRAGPRRAALRRARPELTGSGDPPQKLGLAPMRSIG